MPGLTTPATTHRYDRRVRIPPSVAHQYDAGLDQPQQPRTDTTDGYGYHHPSHTNTMRLDQPQQPRTDTTDGYGYHHPSHTNTMPGLTSPSNHAPQYGERMSGLTSPNKQDHSSILCLSSLRVLATYSGMPDSKRVTRSVATEQGSETPRSTRSTNTQAAGGSMKNSKFTKGKAKEVAAKKKGQEREKEKEKERRTTQVRKRASKIMAEEELLSDEEQPKTKKKKCAVVEDEAEADEQDKAVEDTPEDVEMEDDTTSKQPTTTRPKPKPAYGKFARPETSLDPAEENVAQTLIGGGVKPGRTLAVVSGGGKSTHGTAKPKALPVSGKDKGKARATGKDDSVESEHDPKSDEDSDGGGSDDAYDDDAGDDGSQVEDEDDVDDVGPESQESEDGDDEGEDEGDVVVVSETRAQSKPALAKSTGSGRDSSSRARVADLPAKVRTLVSAAQNCLRLRIALNSAWTKEASVASKRLPRRDILIRDSVRDAYDRRGTGNHAADIKAAFWLLADKKDDKKKDKKEADHTQKDKKKANGDASSDGDEDSERAALRAKAYSVTRNELKRKAKQVIEQTFKLGSLTVPQRTEVVVWLLETHPTEFHFDRKKKLDRELTKVEPTEPFRNECIPELIYQYYGLAGRGDANINAALDEFSKMPFNLIALACNAIEAALMEVTSHNQSIFFSGKLFAAKWDGTMAILETLEDSASEYLEETRELIWKHISNRLNAGPNALEGVTDSDEQPGSFIPLLQLRASKAQSSSDKPGTSKAATKPPSSTAKKGNKSTTSSKTAGKPSGSSKSAKTPNSSQAAKNPPSPSRKTRGAGASTSKSQNHQRRDSDGSEGGEAGGQGHSEDEGGAGLSGEGGEGVQTEIDELRGSGEDRGSGASTNGGA
ncbi:uncharacterized protein B0H18DRAFT_1127804 [Fomitopsis serialis]|uniref:uncharacterized protein n=1 Tax=Fomitopsis serialis TaxID=139415 RepID=UPI002007DE6C|nr:uncharacterized protein B0H18DRAFT_1127804 [Neoantrodia serialis]KAH9911978.1 hypothetical protein B0H18DRAFT_1127804 [Neoantrodia serialis]